VDRAPLLSLGAAPVKKDPAGRRNDCGEARNRGARLPTVHITLRFRYPAPSSPLQPIPHTISLSYPDHLQLWPPSKSDGKCSPWPIHKFRPPRWT